MWGKEGKVIEVWLKSLYRLRFINVSLPIKLSLFRFWSSWRSQSLLRWWQRLEWRCVIPAARRQTVTAFLPLSLKIFFYYYHYSIRHFSEANLTLSERNIHPLRHLFSCKRTAFCSKSISSFLYTCRNTTKKLCDNLGAISLCSRLWNCTEKLRDVIIKV